MTTNGSRKHLNQNCNTIINSAFHWTQLAGSRWQDHCFSFRIYPKIGQSGWLPGYVNLTIVRLRALSFALSSHFDYFAIYKLSNCASHDFPIICSSHFSITSILHLKIRQEYELPARHSCNVRDPIPTSVYFCLKCNQLFTFYKWLNFFYLVHNDNFFKIYSICMKIGSHIKWMV